MYEYTKGRPMGPLPYFRTDEFSDIYFECAERLRRLTGAPGDAHVYLLTCSGTGAMEAVVGGCFAGADRLLVVDGGGFGHRFAELAAHHGVAHEPVRLSFGEGLDYGAVDEALRGAPNAEAFTGMLVNIHETTTGQLYDKDMFAWFCREYGLYLVYDAIGSFLADPLDFEKDGADAFIISSQKALALPPGLAAVILSDRLYKKVVEQDIRPFSLYFDFRDAESNAARGQTPFTPAIGAILALHERLARLEEEGGAEASAARAKALAEDFRARIRGLAEKGLIALPSYRLSNACTPLVFPKGGAKEAYKKLAQRGLWLNPNGGELADTVLRVGHLGNLTPADNQTLAEALSELL